MASHRARLSREVASPYRDPAFGTELASRIPAVVRQAERGLWEEGLAQVVAGAWPHPGVAIDVGCGEGAHLAGLADRFEQVIGLEPDARLAEQARQRRPGTVSVFEAGLQCAALGEPQLAGSFCFAQCLQVLGHLPGATVQAMLARLAYLVGSGRAVLLAIPYTNELADDFSIVTDGAQERRVGREEFEKLAACPVHGQLAVRHFSMVSIGAELSRAGLSQTWCAPYGWVDYQRANLMLLARC